MAEEKTISRYWWLKRLSALVVVIFAAMIGAHVFVSVWFSRQADAAEARWRALPVRMPEDTDGTFSDLNDPTNPAFHIERAIALLPANTQKVTDWTLETRTWPPLTMHDVDVMRPVVKLDLPAFNAILDARIARATGGDYRWALGPLTINTMLPNLGPFRELLNHLQWAMYLAHYDGDLIAMSHRAREARELAIATRSYGDVLVSTVVAISIDSLTAQSLRDCAGHVPPNRTPDEDAALWREAREPVLELVRELMDPTYFDEMRPTAFDAEWIIVMELREMNAAGAPTRNMFTAPTLDRAAVAMSERTAMLREAAIAGGPYPVVKAKLDPRPDRLATTSLAGLAAAAPLESLMLTADLGLDVIYRSRFATQSAAVALALRVYEADHGELPASLDALVPDYLPSLPIDPFDPDEKPLRLIERDGLLFIYSVGPNGIDDDGDPRNAYGQPVEWNELADYVLPLRWDGNGDPLERLGRTFDQTSP